MEKRQASNNKTICILRVDDDCDVIRPITRHGDIIKILNGLIIKSDYKNKTFGLPNKEKIDTRTVCTVKVDDDCQIIRPITSHGDVVEVLGGQKIPTSSGYNKTLGLPGTDPRNHHDLDKNNKDSENQSASGNANSNSNSNTSPSGQNTSPSSQNTKPRGTNTNTIIPPYKIPIRSRSTPIPASKDGKTASSSPPPMSGGRAGTYGRPTGNSGDSSGSSNSGNEN
jgi:hypothetical protein